MQFVASGPVQLPQEALHGVHTVLNWFVQFWLKYVPDPQVEQLEQIVFVELTQPPLMYVFPVHAEHDAHIRLEV